MRFDTLTKWLFGVEISALAFLALGLYVPAETTWIVGFAGGGVVGALIIFAVARRERQAIHMEHGSPDCKKIDYWDSDGRKWTGHIFLTEDDECLK